MASTKRRQFLRQWILQHVRDARVWPEFRARLDAEIARRVTPEMSAKKRATARWYALESAAIATPESAYERGVEKWNKRVANSRRVRRSNRRMHAERVVKASAPEFDAELEKQRELERARREAMKARQRAGLHAFWFRREEQREWDCRHAKEVKMASNREAYAKLVEDRRKYYEEQRMKEKEERDAQVVDVVVEQKDDVDLMGDTLWVYKNLADLILVSDKGVRRLDTELLKKAPSNGAIAIAQYARDNPAGFLEKFVLKIMPKAEEPQQGKSERELMSDLDPAFDDLEKYFKKETE